MKKPCGQAECTERFFSAQVAFKTLPSVGVSNTLEKLPIIFSLCLVSPTREKLPILAFLFKIDFPPFLQTDSQTSQCAEEIRKRMALMKQHSFLTLSCFFGFFSSFSPLLHLWYLNELTGFLWNQEAAHLENSLKGCSFPACRNF